MVIVVILVVVVLQVCVLINTQLCITLFLIGYMPAGIYRASPPPKKKTKDFIDNVNS